MGKSISKLEENYKRELALSEKHKQNAIDIKKEMELLKGNMINQKVKALNLNGAEYDLFMQLLSGKKTVLEAIGIVLEQADTAQESIKKEGDSNNANRVGEGYQK